MSLRSKIIRLAHSDPDLRADLLPLLKVGGKPPESAGGLTGEVRKDFEEKYNLLGDVAQEYDDKIKKIRPLHEQFQKKYDDASRVFFKVRSEASQKIDEIRSGLTNEYKEAKKEYQDAWGELEGEVKKKNEGLWTGLSREQEAEIEDELDEQFEGHKNPAMDSFIREIPQRQYTQNNITRDFDPQEHWKGKPHYQQLFTARCPETWAFGNYGKKEFTKDHIKESLGGNKKFFKGLDLSGTGMSAETLFDDMDKFTKELQGLNEKLKKVPGFKKTTDTTKLMGNLSKVFDQLPSYKDALEGGDIPKAVQKFIDKHPTKKKKPPKKTKEKAKKKKSPKKTKAPKKDEKELLKTKVPNPNKSPGAAKEVTLNTVKNQEQKGKAPKGTFKKWWDKLTGKKAFSPLARSTIRLAHANPELRADLLPLLEKEADRMGE